MDNRMHISFLHSSQLYYPIAQINDWSRALARSSTMLGMHKSHDSHMSSSSLLRALCFHLYFPLNVLHPRHAYSLLKSYLALLIPNSRNPFPCAPGHVYSVRSRCVLSTLSASV